MSTRELLRKARPKVHKLDVADGSVYLRALSGAGRAAYLNLVKGDAAPSFAKIAALALCEEDGSLSYDVDSDKDIAELSEADGKVLESIALKLFEISGLTKEASEEAAKN